MIALSYPRLAALFAAGLAACSSHSSSFHPPSLTDIDRAPAPMQAAARAVVLIGTNGERATGSFISPAGLLLTNNHVLGVDICPIEGCFASITFNEQLHVDPPPTSKSVFVVPVAVDTGLDMALVQVYDVPGGTPLATSEYLTLDSHDAASLVGMHVNLIGHPDGHLAKWSDGEVIDTSGNWVTLSAFALPGNSGSPVLDDAGHMVGIIHRAPADQDLVTGNGIDEYSIGTASAALIAAMSAPLPAAMWSTKNDMASDADAVAHQQVYLNANVATATVAGAPRSIVDSLAAECDAALANQSYASPDDLAAALEPCFDSTGWIDCTNQMPPVTYQVCPADADAWRQRYQKAFQLLWGFNQLELDLVTAAPSALETTAEDGATAARADLQAALATTHPPLDFNLAYYLAQYGILTYQGKSVVDFVRDYEQYPDYGLTGDAVAVDALWLENQGAMTFDEAVGILAALASDPNVTLGAKLAIEDTRYHNKLIQ